MSVLGIAAVPQLDPMPTGDDLGKAYLDAIDLAYNAGARGTELDKTWKDLEPSRGEFNLQDRDFAMSYIQHHPYTEHREGERLPFPRLDRCFKASLIHWLTCFGSSGYPLLFANARFFECATRLTLSPPQQPVGDGAQE
jgi:hypothetical protein